MVVLLYIRGNFPPLHGCAPGVGPLLMERDVGPLIILRAPSVVMSEPTPPHGLRESRREEQRK